MSHLRRVAGLAVLITVACTPPSQPAAQVKLDTDEAKVIYSLGLLLAQRLESFNLSESELVIFEDGLRDGVLGREKKVDPATLDAQLQAFANQRRVAAAEAEKKASAEYLAKMAAEPGATKAESGYVRTDYLVALAKKAGFELIGESEVNANPKDTGDHPNGVWSLPPTLRGGDADRDKFLAIGESDRQTLRFRKPE